MTTISIISIDSSALLGYLNAQIGLHPAQSAGSPSSRASASTPASTGPPPPWNATAQPTPQAEDAAVLATTNFIDLNTAQLITGSSASAKTQGDNQKLFALYQAASSLSTLATLSQGAGTTPGQLTGYNTRFQAGLQQVESFVASQTFNDFTLQAGQTSSSATSAVSMPLASFAYTGATVVSDANVENALPGVSASDSFTVAVTKGGTTTNVPIDLSQVQGSLTIDNIVSYVNQQLSQDGFATRFARTITQGSVAKSTTASYGIAMTPAPGETVSLSSASATPALYVAGSTGSPTSTTTTSGGSTTTTAADGQGRLIKLTDLSTSPQSVFNQTVTPTSGTTTAQSTVVDGTGNVYVVGNATGNFGNEINQGSQDVYLSKYDSAGNLQWSKLLGSSTSASAYSLAVNPAGGVVVAGSTTADLTSTAIANGNTDSFAAEYDADGNQTWVTQIPTLANNQAQSVSVDGSGNVYIGGQVSGEIGAGQTSQGGSDAYVTKLDSSGNTVYEQQFGTSGNDQVSATATTADGGLLVASEQNGEAVLSKYANGDATSAPLWQIDMGALTNGSISGIAVSGNQIYVSGSTTNAALDAGGAAAIANPNSGGSDAFVFKATDNGSGATSNYVSYVGTSGTDQGGQVTVGPDGTVYLAGTTTGTFAGQTRNVTGANNMFVTSMSPDGTIDWTRQYGGADGQSSGQGIAIDPQGSSVLDALGLPRGTVNIDQSVDLTQQTTLQPGDSFSVDVQGSSQRSATITIGAGETLQSLVDKINGEFLSGVTASVSYGNGGETLKIAVSPGVTANLVPGPTGFDALSRLGLTAGELTAPAKAGSSTSASNTTNSSSTASTTPSAATVFGLGLTPDMDISTTTSAGAAQAVLKNVMAQIQNIYQKINAPPSSSGSTTPQVSGPVPAYLTSQIANYSLALALSGR